MKLIRLIVSGEVQGVGYRNSIFQFINSEYLQILGYIRNMPNGTVEIILKGELDDLRTVEKFAFEGSPLSEVEHIDRIDLVDGGEQYEDFYIDY